MAPQLDEKLLSGTELHRPWIHQEGGFSSAGLKFRQEIKKWKSHMDAALQLKVSEPLDNLPQKKVQHGAAQVAAFIYHCDVFTELYSSFETFFHAGLDAVLPGRFVVILALSSIAKMGIHDNRKLFSREGSRLSFPEAS